MIKQQALDVVNMIEQLGVNDSGMKRAHARGIHYKGSIKLNERGTALFGERTNILIRMSDAPPNKRHPSWMIPLKGLSVYMEGQQPVNLIFVTFPYFPWTKAQSIVSLAIYANAVKQADDWRVKANIIRRMLKVESFHQHLGQFVKHLPRSIIRKYRSYYNPHYYEFKNQFIKFHIIYHHHKIKLYAGYFETPYPINQLTTKNEIYEIGTITLNKQCAASRAYFEVYEAGPYLKPVADDEILQLRHEMYLISNQRRLNECRDKNQ